jgi:hypothetical protein
VVTRLRRVAGILASIERYTLRTLWEAESSAYLGVVREKRVTQLGGAE